MDIVQLQNLYPLLSPSVLLACRDHGVPVVMRCPNYRLFCPNGLHLSKGEVCERCLGPGGELWCILRDCAGHPAKSIGYACRNFVARTTGMIRRNVDVFVVLSEFQKRRFVSAGIDGRRLEVLPNFVSDPGTDSLPRYRAGETVSFLGRLGPGKGVECFLEAARALPEYRFAVAGDASRARGMVATAPPNVAFQGYLVGSRLDEFHRRTMVLVCPSTCFEGFPNVVARAMVAGKPVVCSRIGGLPEIVEDGITGLLFESGDAKDLAEKVRYLRRRPKVCRRMGKAGRDKALREYSADRYYERLMAVYRRAIELGPAGAPRRRRQRTELPRPARFGRLVRRPTVHQCHPAGVLPDRPGRSNVLV